MHQGEGFPPESCFEERHSGKGMFGIGCLPPGARSAEGGDSPEVIDVISALKSILDCSPLQEIACGDLGMRARAMVIARFTEGMHVDGCSDHFPLKMREIQRDLVAWGKMLHLRRKKRICVGGECMTFSCFFVELQEEGKIANGIRRRFDGDTFLFCTADEVARGLAHLHENFFLISRSSGIDCGITPIVFYREWEMPDMFCEEMERRIEDKAFAAFQEHYG